MRAHGRDVINIEGSVNDVNILASEVKIIVWDRFTLDRTCLFSLFFLFSLFGVCTL